MNSFSESVCLLIDIYVERVYSFWKEPIVQAWLERIIPIAFETKTKSTIDKSLFHSTIPKSYYRHLYLTDVIIHFGFMII